MIKNISGAPNSVYSVPPIACPMNCEPCAESCPIEFAPAMRLGGTRSGTVAEIAGLKNAPITDKHTDTVNSQPSVNARD